MKPHLRNPTPGSRTAWSPFHRRARPGVGRNGRVDLTRGLGRTIESNRLRAFDKDTGYELFEMELPARSSAAPISYLADGRQYVVLAVGGGAEILMGDDEFRALQREVSGIIDFSSCTETRFRARQ